MGTWGVEIFSDDLASEIRGEFSNLIAKGDSVSTVVKRLTKDYKEELSDPDDEMVFWLSLAASQLELGTVQPEVKAKALQIIDSGAELNRWNDNEKLKNDRKVVLDSLKEQLLLPILKGKHTPKSSKILGEYSNYEIGDILSYRLRSGDIALFRVIGFHTDKGGTYPVCEVLDWTGNRIPDVEEISKMPIRREDSARGYSQFMLGAIRKKAPDKLTKLGINTPPTQQKGGYAIFPREFLDKLLQDIFNLS